MDILDPLKEYNSVYAPEFKEKTAQYFEDLVTKAGVNEEENVKTVEEYNETMNNKASFEKKLRSAKTQKTIGIIFIILGFIAAIVGILDVAGVMGLELGVAIDVVMIVVGILLAVSIILIICLKLNKKIAELKKTVSDLATKAKEIQDLAYSQMAPLNNLFSPDMTAELIHDELPMIKINRYLSGKFNDMMAYNFGFSELTDVNKSTVDVVSGTYYNSPFVTERNLIHEMGSKMYYGELLITWEEEYTDSEGHVHTRTKSETLHAEVLKPFPEYYDMTSTLFLSDATPELIFTRSPKLKGNESEKKLDKLVRKGEKKIDKMAKKALKNGESNFAGLNNSEFDVLFDALDRNDERAFNLLFSPAAQSNLTELIKSKAPYGDDFHFHKNGKFNVLMSDHMQGYDINFDENKFKSYDIRESRKVFNDYNNDFFLHFYFELAPIFSVPLFNDYAQNEYEIPETSASYTSTREATSLANYLVDEFRPADADTTTIIKLVHSGNDGKLDKYVVNAYAYRGEERVDFIPKRGGDGYIHEVPVPWIEYVPTSNQKYLWVADLWDNAVEKNNFLNENSLRDDFGVDASQAVQNNGLLGFTNNVNAVSEEQIAKFNGVIK